MQEANKIDYVSFALCLGAVGAIISPVTFLVFGGLPMMALMPLAGTYGLGLGAVAFVVGLVTSIITGFIGGFIGGLLVALIYNHLLYKYPMFRVKFE